MRIAALVLAAAAAGCSPREHRPPELESAVRATDAASGLDAVTGGLDAEMFPSVTPDGKRVFFQSSALPGLDGAADGFFDDLAGQWLANWEIRSCAPDGSAPARVTNFSGFDGAPVPSNDTVTFVALRTAKLGIWSARHDGAGGARLVRDMPGLVDRAMPSPDGKRFAFGWTPTGDWKDGGVWVCEADGGGLVQLAQGCRPAWSPDGSRLAFVRERAIHVMGADGTGASPGVGADGAEADWPCWSPDGRRLVFQWRDSRETGWDIAAAEPGGAPVRLTATYGSELSPWWSADGWIYFAAETLSPDGKGKNWNIWRLKPKIG